MKKFLVGNKKILIVTEKYSAEDKYRDGGARLINSLLKVFDEKAEVICFSNKKVEEGGSIAYPFYLKNRFERRLANASFIRNKIEKRQKNFTHIIFVHVSMQFGLVEKPLANNLKIWTFPMFLSPSYEAAGEIVPQNYKKAEMMCLKASDNVITPSYFEKLQLTNLYNVPEKKVHVIPRGIEKTYFPHKVRNFKTSPVFCSVGSIKRQKNTLELVRFFSGLTKKYPKASLIHIGPIQDTTYAQGVFEEVEALGLKDAVKFMGYIDPRHIQYKLKDCHIHLSFTNCETFGRSIFETLALGIPNIVSTTNNAAYDFLSTKPYCYFFDDIASAEKAVGLFLKNLPQFSELAQEVGELFNDDFLARLISSKIYEKPNLCVSDFDGTLYHKDDASKTKRCMHNFQKYEKRIICTARGLKDILVQIRKYQLQVDWIVSYSGALVTDGGGKILFITPLEPKDLKELNDLLPNPTPIFFDNQIIQVKAASNVCKAKLLNYNIEQYVDGVYITSKAASKIHATIKLLNHINWDGQVIAYGDKPSDEDMINYFDGKKITPYPTSLKERKEIRYE